jgi:POT family proton-dependent oligopeptide transporter
VGFFTIAASFMVVSWIEKRIQGGHVVSVWWQICAYVVLTASEILVSINGLEFSYKQAPLKMKSFVMALFLLAVSLGNAMTALVNSAMVKPITAVAAESGAATWLKLSDAHGFVLGQKIDVDGETGLTWKKPDGKTDALKGTYLVSQVDEANGRIELMDVVDRKPISTIGNFDAAKAKVSTYRLVGPEYFNFFVLVMAGVGVLFIFVAMAYKEKTHVRENN